jgi:hypothetical protein
VTRAMVLVRSVHMFGLGFYLFSGIEMLGDAAVDTTIGCNELGTNGAKCDLFPLPESSGRLSKSQTLPTYI